MTTANTQSEFVRDGHPGFDLEFLIPDLTYSVCSASDIQTWRRTSLSLLEFIPSRHHAVIVPDNDISLFKTLTDKKITVIPETAYIGDLKIRLAERMSNKNRIGWYLQQFIKLAVLKEARSNENYLIWDADTVALRKIGFFERSGTVQFYVGTENHTPYFDTIKKLLGLDKVATFSFIAQTFPCKGIWAKEFFQYIEDRCQDNYVNAIIDRANLNESSGFSEYETLGSFILNRFEDQIKIKSDKWLRTGPGLIGGIDNLDRQPYKQLLHEFDHVTFEHWHEPFGTLRNQSQEFIQQFLKNEKISKPSLAEFLGNLFHSNSVRTIIQIGAKDRAQSDFLRNHLIAKGIYEATIIEPIPHYAEKLKNLYVDRPDVRITQVAVGNTEELRDLFFIPPTILNEIKEDSIENKWEHGQGSFDKDSVIAWIKANSFKEQNCSSMTDNYINSISSITVSVVKTEHLLPRNRNGLLLTIDASSSPKLVLDGIDWNNPPRWVVVEGDLNDIFDMLKFFFARGFHWVAGEHDKLFMRI
jgi:hypothetical protein